MNRVGPPIPAPGAEPSRAARPAAVRALPVEFRLDDRVFNELEHDLDEHDQILWCFMRPSGRPSYTHELMEEIGEVQARVEAFFRGRGAHDAAPFRYFVSGSRTPGIYNLGGDLGHFVERIRDGDLASMRHYAHVCIERQYLNAHSFNAPIITIALVQGDALGGGFEHALSLDVLVAERSAKMGLPEVLFNLFPGMGAYSFLSRKIGRAKAEEFIMSGKIYSGEELHALGVVDVLAEDGDGERAVRAYVHQHIRKFNTHRAVMEARRRVNPVRIEELRDITDLWAETALGLTDFDLRKMLRLTAAQDRRLSGSRGSGAIHPVAE